MHKQVRRVQAGTKGVSRHDGCEQAWRAQAGGKVNNPHHPSKSARE